MVAELALSSNRQAASASSYRVLLLHSQVISSNSAFFRACLTSPVGAGNRQRGSSTDALGRWQLRTEINEEDADAAEAVLRFFYQQQLAEGSSGLDLLKILKSPKLMADAEASVLLLVSSWLEQPTGQSCSEAEVLELQSLTRYSRLSRPYVTGLCE
ncbi:MAG: hypothetical protein WDW38_007268 [Sanguina aurantia]